MTDTFLFLLIFVAPIVQISLSIFRIANKTTLSIGVIAGLALFLGIALSILAGTIFKQLPPCKNCGAEGTRVIGVYLTIEGLLVTFFSVPIISLISYIAWRYKNSQLSNKQSY